MSKRVKPVLSTKPCFYQNHQTNHQRYRKMGGLRILGSKISLFCIRVEWALKLKGVEYEYIHEDLMNKSPLLIQYNPVHKKVPVLVQGDDTAISESLVILEYIDEVWKENPLLPEDPYERAIARFWAKFNDEKCAPGAFYAAMAEGEEKEKLIKTTKESLSFLEQQIQGKKFFAGENIGYLDLVIGWVPVWLKAMEEVGEMNLLDDFPFLNEWAQNFYQIEHIKECYPTKEETHSYLKAAFSYMRSLGLGY